MFEEKKDTQPDKSGEQEEFSKVNFSSSKNFRPSLRKIDRQLERLKRRFQKIQPLLERSVEAVSSTKRHHNYNKMCRSYKRAYKILDKIERTQAMPDNARREAVLYKYMLRAQGHLRKTVRFAKAFIHDVKGEARERFNRLRREEMERYNRKNKPRDDDDPGSTLIGWL